MFGRTCISAGLFLLITVTGSLAHAQAEALPIVPTPPPPAAADPGPVVEAPGRDRTRGLVLVPCLGMNVPMGSLADGYTQGFHFGVLGGWHLSPRVSMNGGLALDLMNDDFGSGIFNPHEHYFDASLVPLVHFHSNSIFIGPQIGWFENHRSRSDSGRSNLFSGGQRSGLPGESDLAPSGPTLVKHSGQGLLAGATVGAFAPVGRLALGLVANLRYRRFLSAVCEGSACAGQLGSVVSLDVSLAALY